VTAQMSTSFHLKIFKLDTVVQIKQEMDAEISIEFHKSPSIEFMALCFAQKEASQQNEDQFVLKIKLDA